MTIAGERANTWAARAVHAYLRDDDGRISFVGKGTGFGAYKSAFDEYYFGLTVLV